MSRPHRLMLGPDALKAIRGVIDAQLPSWRMGEQQRQHRPPQLLNF
jgi:hypothetical protein